MKKSIIAIALLASTSLSAIASESKCLQVKPNDILTNYYQAMSTGDANAMTTIFSKAGYGHGHIEDGVYSNKTPLEMGSIVNQLHSLSAKETETCRVSTQDLGQFSIVVSRYKLSLSVPVGEEVKVKSLTGIKTITVNNTTNKIVSMNFENDK